MVSGAALAASPLAAAEQDAVRSRVEASGTSFYWAMRLLPKSRREAMYAVYAFCREVDDIADDAPPAERGPGLDRWRDEIAALYEGGRPRDLVARALAGPIARYDLRREDFLAVIDGMAMDAAADIRAPSLAELDLYCDRVASAVGRLSVRIFGDYVAAADEVAHHLGRALQLTNILRDLAEDGERGRLYLPRELLDRHGIAGSDPAVILADAALPAVCRDLAAIAEEHYRDAEAAMRRCSRHAMRPARVMGAVYKATLDRLVAAGWRDLAERGSLPKARKIWLVLRHGLA
jgi:squalene synthase HpnD